MAIRQLVLAGVLTTALAGCSGSQVPGSPAASGEAKPASEAAKPATDADPKNDVKVVGCKGGKYSLSVTVEATNTRGVVSEYYGQIHFLDTSGRQIAVGEYNSGAVQPGGTSRKEVPGDLLEAPEKVTCEVGWIKLGNPDN